ncbi:TPA: hypothetical protein ACKP1J_004501 [Serratia liquefaciens]
MKVTVVLKDAHGNAVTGQAATLASSVKVGSGTLNGVWAEASAGSGTYVATYTAGVAGSALKATLTLADATQVSKEYDIYAAEAVVANSTIKLDKSEYVVGDAITVTVTLKDKASNPLVGEDSATLKGFVTVHGATLKEDWLEGVNEDGTYQATYTATAEVVGQVATLTLTDGSKSADNKYTIKPVPAVTGIVVNGYTFAKDAGLPTMGFEGARFTLELSGGHASDYNWTADASWVSVVDGVVAFTGDGTSSRVTISGVPKSGRGGGGSLWGEWGEKFNGDDIQYLWVSDDAASGRHYNYGTRYNAFTDDVNDSDGSIVGSVCSRKL